MSYKVLVPLSAPDQRYRPDDLIPKERYGASLIQAWLRDHWIEDVDEKKPLIACPYCDKAYKTLAGWEKHVAKEHSEGL